MSTNYGTSQDHIKTKKLIKVDFLKIKKGGLMMKKIKFNKKPVKTLKLNTKKVYGACDWWRGSGTYDCSQSVSSCGMWSGEHV